MAVRGFPASTYVAAQTKNIRKRRGWSQQRLANRLTELLTGTPPGIYEQEDPRRRPAVIRSRQRKWTQSRVAKLERGAVKPGVDDLLELALALDVSPLALITPMLEPEDREEDWALLRPEENDVLGVTFGPDREIARSDIAYRPSNVRQWIRGAKPLLSRGDYRTDAEAVAGYRFYMDAQGQNELQKAAATAEELRRAWRPVESLLEETEKADA
jgi:transcriptional regulator with XRE-family HTH domain